MATRPPKWSKAANRMRPFCEAQTLAGTDCPQFAATPMIKGKRYQLKTCIMHASPKIKNHFGLINPGVGNRGRKPMPKPDDILRARFEADAARYLAPLEEALTAMKATVVGNGASAHIEMVEDFGLRLRALETLLDRIAGRARQSVEHTGHEGEAIKVEVPSSKDRQLEVAAILAATGALGQVEDHIPVNASANDPSNN